MEALPDWKVDWVDKSRVSSPSFLKLVRLNLIAQEREIIIKLLILSRLNIEN